MRFLILLTLLICPSLTAALIPMPREIQAGEGELKVDVQTAVIAPKELEVPAGVLTAALQKTTGYLHRWRTPTELRGILLNRAVRLEMKDLEKEESYRLEITPEGVTIQGSDLAGLMHGVQTFVQMLPVGKEPFPRVMIPSQTIVDWPESKRRIFHLNVSAYIFPTADLKSFVDWMSFHKLNELHLQLNGDSGWRMESLKFPKLHEIGSVRASSPPYGDPTGSDSTEYGGYYPQENLRELVAYAEARGIDLVPCFSFVTGASALIAAYPDLGKAPAKVATTWEDREIGVVQNEETLKFLDDLLAEVATVFSSKVVRLEGEGGEFHGQLKARLAKNQKVLFEAKGIPSANFAIYSRPEEAELLMNPKLKAEKGLYSLRQVYELEAHEVMEASLRTRYVPAMDKLQYLVFPRIAAFAEAAWVPAEKRKYEDFREKIDDLVMRYRLMGVQSSAPYDPPTGAVLGGTLVTHSLTAREGHEAEMIFDGRRDTFFWSQDDLKKGDHLTLEFPWPIEGDVTVATGRAGGGDATAPGTLIDGVLDLSADGKEWDAAAEFFDGLVTVTVPAGTKFVRIRVFAPQEDSLILHEVTLSEPLMMPKHEESRQVRLPVTGERITLTFKADFEKYPELRDEIGVIRRAFYKEWLPLSVRLGLAHDSKTPRVFEVKSGEPGELSDAEAQEWLIERLIPRIQSYPASAPLWFATGMAARLKGNLPKKPKRSKCLEGGPETAVFLEWISGKFAEEALMAISQDCRWGRYHPSVWKLLTKMSLEELCQEFQAGQ